MIAESQPSSKSKGVIIGIAVGCGVLFVALAGAAAYAFIQRRRAQKAKEELGGPFGMFSFLLYRATRCHVHLTMPNAAY